MVSSLLALVGALVVLGAGNTVGYHRLLTHRAFRAGPGLRAMFAFLGALHSGPPMLWVGLHRLHHLRSDQPDDPHSPRDKGFWFAHCGWLLWPGAGTAASLLFAISGFGQQVRALVHDVRRLLGQNPPVWHELCPDLQKEPALRLLERPLVTPALFVVQLALAWTVGGSAGLWWLWGVHVVLTNSSWSVNSICHTPRFGRAPYATGDDSRDVPWLALSTGGESYHNTHHRYPRSARHGLNGGFDPSWWMIRALVALGLASEPWLPKEQRDRMPGPVGPG